MANQSEAAASRERLDARYPPGLGMVTELGQPIIAPEDYNISVCGGQPASGAPGVNKKLHIDGMYALPDWGRPRAPKGTPGKGLHLWPTGLSSHVARFSAYSRLRGVAALGRCEDPVRLCKRLSCRLRRLGSEHAFGFLRKSNSPSRGTTMSPASASCRAKGSACRLRSRRW